MKTTGRRNVVLACTAVVLLGLMGGDVGSREAAVRSAATVSSGSGQPEMVFARIGLIRGGSTDRDHKDWIEASSARYTIVQSEGSRGGAAANRPDFSEATIVKAIDRATPYLTVACARGERYADGEIHFARMVGGQMMTYLRIKLTNITVQRFAAGIANPADGSRSNLEEISLRYETIEWEYTPFDAKGQPEASVKMGWNLTKNMPK